ncbi:MAG: HD domain-containing protein [Gemmatimonadaceae bacterium]|nr:HD domain-containing protein [Gemmatimonadaceae bacterium]
MNPLVQFLTALGQSLAAMSLYAPAHPMRASARSRALASLHGVLSGRGTLQLSFLDGEVVAGSRALHELRGWDWAQKLARAGVQRLEIEAAPLPTDDDLEQLFAALHLRLSAPHGTPCTAFRHAGVRAGPIDVMRDGGPDDAAVMDLLEAVGLESLDEEASAVRWIHDEAANDRPIPLAEVEAVVRSLSAAMHRDEHVILPLLELKTIDQYTTTHSCNVAMLSMGLAEQLGLGPSDVRAIGTAALLHDIGKVRVPPELLVKPGKLTDEEFAAIQRHAPEGARILTMRGRGHELAAIVAYEHHIWEDGSRGYPRLVYPRRCHYASRIVHVCDLFDALSTRRPYRDAWPRERTLAMLESQAGIEVDADVARAFIRLAEIAPEQRLTLEEEPPQNDWTASVSRAMVEFAPPVAAGAA